MYSSSGDLVLRIDVNCLLILKPETIKSLVYIARQTDSGCFQQRHRLSIYVLCVAEIVDPVEAKCVEQYGGMQWWVNPSHS